MIVAQWPHGDPALVARAILRDPQYHVAPSGPPSAPSWLDVLGSWCSYALHALLDRFMPLLDAGRPFGTAIGVGVAVAGVAVLVLAGVALVRSYRRATAQRTNAPSAQGALRSDGSAATLRAAARTAARAGRYRDAAALLFGAAVFGLAERGVVAYDASRTPGEYRRLVRDPHFDVLAAEAVVAMFGAAEPRADAFDRMTGAYDRYFAAPAR